MFSVVPYTTPNGKDVVANWLDGLRDYKVVARILARMEKLRDGHFGDCKAIAGGVWELRVNIGPGYRLRSAAWQTSLRRDRK
jgi:putative addiction module killer protein